jgi:bacteriocin-like protein
MKNFDLNLLGVKELDNNQLMKINGGEIQPGPSVWWSVVNNLLQIAWIFFTDLIPKAEEALCNRASKDGYVIWADVSHR